MWITCGANRAAGSCIVSAITASVAYEIDTRGAGRHRIVDCGLWWWRRLRVNPASSAVAAPTSPASSCRIHLRGAVQDAAHGQRIPSTGKPYPDKAGSTTTENYWLRSWSNDLYLWYSEMPDRDPALTNDTLAYFDLLKTSATTPSGRPRTSSTSPTTRRTGSRCRVPARSWAMASTGTVVTPTPPRAIVRPLCGTGSAAAAAGISRGLKVLLTDNVDVVNDNTSAGVDKILEALYPMPLAARTRSASPIRQPAQSLNVTLTAAVVTQRSGARSHPPSTRRWARWVTCCSTATTHRQRPSW